MPGPSLNTGGLANRNRHRKHTSRLVSLQVHTHKTHQDKFTAAVPSCKCPTYYTLIQLQQFHTYASRAASCKSHTSHKGFFVFFLFLSLSPSVGCPHTNFQKVDAANLQRARDTISSKYFVLVGMRNNE